MNNNFNLDELEEFLSDSAEQHRMYPSDKVWRNIDKELHGNKKWPALTFGAVVTGALITAGLILAHPDKALFTTPNVLSEDKQYDKTPIAESNPANEAVIVDFYTRKSSQAPISSTSVEPAGQHTETEALAKTANDRNSPNASSIKDDAIVNAGQNNVLAASGLQNEKTAVEEPFAKLSGDAPGAFIQNSESISRKTAFLPVVSSLENGLALNESRFKTAIPKTAGDYSEALALKSLKKNRWSSFFYITPSISYRYLAESKYYDFHLLSGPIAPNLTHDVNSFVTQKPIGGLEVGGGYMYQLSPSLRLRAGLQANIRGYKIEAYATRNQATALVLDRGLYTDSIMTLSSVSNMRGTKAIEVNNRYFELSIPLTVDLKVAGFKKFEVYVAGGLQATYQFNSNMYMVSNDYKNYVQSPELTRKFNVNTSLEAYLSYKAGKLTWQLGPQVRYQLMPGTIKQYPIGEHLFDYGLKIGVVKSLF